MFFGILGPLDVRLAGGEPISVGGPRVRVLLALLLLNAGRLVGPERLIDGLYGENPPAGAANALQSQISRLRRGLADADGPVEFHPAGYRLAVDPDDVDAHRFERLAAKGRQALTAGDHRRAATLLGDALGRWRGPALTDLLDAPFAAAQATRLEERRLAVVEDRAEAELALGEHDAAVTELREPVAAHPGRRRPAGLSHRRRHRRRGAARLHRARRAAPGDRTGGGPAPLAAGRRDRDPAGRPVQAALAGRPHEGAPAPDPAGRRRVELAPAGRGRTGAGQAADRLLRRGHAGGAAERVCGLPEADTADLLAGLADKSLVEEMDGRYRMLDTIRAFCAEQLAEAAGEEGRLRRAHATYFRELMEDAEPHLRRAEQLEWLDRLRPGHGNLEAALRGASVAGDPDVARLRTGARALAGDAVVRAAYDRGAAMGHDAALAEIGAPVSALSTRYLDHVRSRPTG